MLKVLLFILLVILIESCQTRNNNCITNYNIYGVKESEGCMKGLLKVGIWNYYYPNGKIESIVRYSNGVMNGQSQQYYKNGKLSSEVIYRNGKLYGIVKNYYENGNLNTEEYYDEKSLTQGTFKLWFESGKLSETGIYLNGKIVGKCFLYYENEKIKENRYYDSSGRKDSIWSYYSINGTLIRKEKYKADSLILNL